MKYISTRGDAPILGFNDVLLAGLARDGGLYVPESWPQLSLETIKGFAGKPYADVAFEVMWPYVSEDLDEAAFRGMIAQAYDSFDHKAVAPLVQVDHNDWLVELFHGPTLAFKDVAMQILSRLMDNALTEENRRATIVGATSGDTGGAAIEAFRGRDAIDIFILHPHGRVSDVQRKQMTTATESNVYNIAVEGTFDDCQALVKGLFNDLDFRDEIKLAGVNSINWARILAQVVYYFTASAALGVDENRKMAFSVPTGNFGDIFAGFVAHKMGLPIEKLVIATNVNDILARTLHEGTYQPQGVVATVSPSMDIQVSSNFERLLFELSGRDPERIKGLMADFASKGSFTLSSKELEPMRAFFAAYKIDEAATVQTISDVYEANGYIADPHSAVGLGAAVKLRDEEKIGDDVPLLTLATAHPAKFPDAVKKAVGQDPGIPEKIKHQQTMEERFVVLPNDLEQLSVYVRKHSRAV